MDPLVEDARDRGDAHRLPAAPRHPIALAAAGLRSLGPPGTSRRLFEGEKARGALRGQRRPLVPAAGERPSALFGFLLGTLGHAFGWPLPKGGSQKIADALASYLAPRG